jgi:superfamily I DNA/RNA helicase
MISDAAQDGVLADESDCLLVEAPPGSGKTYTAVRLVGRDVDTGRVGSTQRALVLTFSRSARSQLDSYAAELLTPSQRARTEITNYHAWFWQKVTQYRTSLGLPLDIELVTEAEREVDVLGAMELEGVQTSKKDRRQVSDYSTALEYGLPNGLPDRLAAEPRPSNREIAARLRKLHRSTGRVHYDDLAYYTWLLLDGSRTLRRLWRHKYPVIVLDEYQDSSPLQAAIIDRLAGQGTRLYGFADPLQQIYEWRDASKGRLDEFRANHHPSEHKLRTLHRYRHRPALQAWMQQARDVLLDDAGSVTATRPREIGVMYYDPGLPEKNKVWGAEARELFQIDEPISKAIKSSEARTVGVIARRRAQLDVLERHLAKRFRCGRLRASEDALDLAIGWVDGYATAITVEHHTQRLLELAAIVAPRHKHLDFASRVGPDGIDPTHLREPRRALAEGITTLARRCETLIGAFRAVHDLTRLVCESQDARVIDWDSLYAIRRVLQSSSSLSDSEAADRAHARIRQARFSAAPTPRRGIYLLTCHEGKGKEFDFVVLPYVSNDNFEDDEESRQLLYVSLSRARQWILVRLAKGKVPPICQRLGLV